MFWPFKFKFDLWYKHESKSAHDSAQIKISGHPPRTPKPTSDPGHLYFVSKRGNFVPSLTKLALKLLYN